MRVNGKENNIYRERDRYRERKKNIKRERERELIYHMVVKCVHWRERSSSSSSSTNTAQYNNNFK